MTRRKNVGQRSRLKMICIPCKPFNTTIEKRSNKYISDCFWHGGVTYCPSLLIFSGMSKFPQASFSLCWAFEARLVGMSRFHNIVFFIIVLVITVFFNKLFTVLLEIEIYIPEVNVLYIFL